MTLTQFAETHRLRTKRDNCKETIIPGKQGQVFEYSDSELGVLFMPKPTPAEPWGRWQPKRWGNYKRSSLQLGLTLRQNADSEGTLSFDPNNSEHVNLALKIAKVFRRKVATNSQRAALNANRRLAAQGVLE